jgi:hypothetical protein
MLLTGVALGSPGLLTK